MDRPAAIDAEERVAGVIQLGVKPVLTVTENGHEDRTTGCRVESGSISISNTGGDDT